MAMLRTPFTMARDQARMQGIQQAIRKPPMVPTNNPGATRALGANRPMNTKAVLPRLQPNGQMQAQNFGPAPGPQNGIGQPPSLQGMINSHVPSLPTQEPVNPPPTTTTPTPAAIGGPDFASRQDAAGVAMGKDLAAQHGTNADRAADNTAAMQQNDIGTDNDPNAGKTNEQLRDEAIRELLSGGVRDTKDEEALIQQLMGDQIGQQLVNQRASMGRAGGGFNGASQALEGDIQRQAREQALQEIFGVQKGARDEFRQNVGEAAQLDQAASDQEFTNWLREQLVKQDTGAPAPAPPPNDGTPGDNSDAGSWVNGLVSYMSGNGWDETDHSQTAPTETEQRQQQAAPYEKYAKEVTEVPAGYTLFEQKDGYRYYRRGRNSNDWVKVKI